MVDISLKCVLEFTCTIHAFLLRGSILSIAAKQITPKFGSLKTMHIYHIVVFVGHKFRYSLAGSSVSVSRNAAVLPWNREHPLPGINEFAFSEQVARIKNAFQKLLSVTKIYR